MNYAEMKARILSESATSFWLKAAIERLDGRDPIDAVNDTFILNKMMETRVEELTGVAL